MGDPLQHTPFFGRASHKNNRRTASVSELRPPLLTAGCLAHTSRSSSAGFNNFSATDLDCTELCLTLFATQVIATRFTALAFPTKALLLEATAIPLTPKALLALAIAATPLAIPAIVRTLIQFENVRQHHQFDATSEAGTPRTKVFNFFTPSFRNSKRLMFTSELPVMKWWTDELRECEASVGFYGAEFLMGQSRELENLLVT